MERRRVGAGDMIKEVGRHGKGAGDMEVKGEDDMEGEVRRHGNGEGEGDMEVKGGSQHGRGGWATWKRGRRHGK